MRQLEVIMLVGVPKEIKTYEYRVGFTSATVSELTARGSRTGS
jgi:alanine dehydrogenase